MVTVVVWFTCTQVLFCRWILKNEGDEFQFVSGGSAVLHFWRVEGSSMSKKESRNGKYKQQTILCAANLIMKDKHRLICGTSSGDLYVLEDRNCVNSIDKGHAGAVLSLAEGLNSMFLISGGADKCVKIWNQALQAISFFQFNQDNPLISPVNAMIGSLDHRMDDNNNIIILVGTYGGEIFELSANNSELNAKKKTDLSVTSINLDLSSSTTTVLVHSHYKGELWGLATHPTNPDIFATCGVSFCIVCVFK